MSDIKLSATAISIDPESVKQLVDQAVENSILGAVSTLGTDPEWISKIERMINQAVVQRTLAGLSAIDVGTVIRDQVNENMRQLKLDLLENFSSTGIDDRASSCQLTILDDTTVVENKLTARSAEIVDDFTVKTLIVKGSINTDNRSWQELAGDISRKTLELLNDNWREGMIKDIAERMKTNGVDFDHVTIQGEKLIDNDRLSSHIRESNLQSVGELKTLSVRGESRFNNTAYVLNRRLGINTEEPEMALSVWDEEVAVLVGKHKDKTAYIGTKGAHGIVLGVNRANQLEIDADGLTTIKKLRVGSHKISHSNEVPGWSGTRGDIIFNSNPGADQVFAWVCLGAYKWQALKSA